MNRWIRHALPIAWTGFFLIPCFYGVIWAIERYYEVPLDPESFRFERPWAWVLLPAALMVLAARGWIQTYRAPRLRVSRARDLEKVSKRGMKRWFTHVPTGARTVAVLLVGLALMGPQSIHARHSQRVEGIDIVLVMDMSMSMDGADIRPNRVRASQEVVDDFIRRRPNDRIGAVVFGSEAYTLLPLTTDHTALRGGLEGLRLGMINGSATAIGNAVGTALLRLRHSRAASRTIILLTDGNSNSGNVSPMQAADIAQNLRREADDAEPDEESDGVRIYTVLMGASGSDTMRRQSGTDMTGRPIWDITQAQINPELLQEMAETTGGAYFEATDRSELERSFHDILDQLERSEIEDEGSVYGELYPALVWPALFLLALELLIANLWLRRWP